VDDKPLTITQSQEPGRAVLRLAGTLDASTVPDAGRALRDSRDGTGVCVDLSELSFVDSTGLSLLVRAQRQASAHGQELEFVPPGGQPARVLIRMHLDTLLRFTSPLDGHADGDGDRRAAPSTRGR